jgi:hypothetical protein
MTRPTPPLRMKSCPCRSRPTAPDAHNIRRLPLLAALTAIVGGCATTDPRTHVSARLETPNYVAESRDGPFEMRRYAPRVVATVRTTGGRDTASRAGFRRLARYIFGGNRRGDKVAMTAPVSATPYREFGDDRSGRAARSDDTDAWDVMFTMPAAWTLQTLPAPLDEGVRLTRQPTACYAAHVFSGLTTDAAIAKHTAQLNAWLERRGVQATGEPTLARYNTPWTLPWKRRNEIVIAVAQPACDDAARAR